MNVRRPYFIICIFLSKEYCIFVRMTTLTVNINDKKTERAIKAVLDAFGLDYNIDQRPDASGRVLSKSEQVIFDRLKRSAEQIKLYKEGKIKLRPIEEVLAELS